MARGVATPQTTTVRPSTMISDAGYARQEGSTRVSINYPLFVRPPKDCRRLTISVTYKERGKAASSIRLLISRIQSYLRREAGVPLRLPVR